MAKHTQTIRVFDHFVGLALKGLNRIGPTTDPCGTADNISLKVILILFTLTHCFQLFKYE